MYMKDLLVGYSRVNITPDYPVAMAGGAATRISEGALDPIYITCIALRQGNETILFATMDLVGTYEEFAAPVTTAISKAVELPENRIILNQSYISHKGKSISCWYGGRIHIVYETLVSCGYSHSSHTLIERCSFF